MKYNKNIILCLNGGLGNQLFQYAFARALSENSKRNLIIDDSTGFKLDKTYKRTFQLDKFGIKYSKINIFQKLLFLLTKLDPHFHKYSNLYNYRFYSDYIIEREFILNHIILGSKKNTFLIGYWQSPLYFNTLQKNILKELSPPPSSNNLFKELAQKIENSNAVAIGVRLYEETANPEILSNTGLVKTINDINGVIDKMNKTILNPCYFIFCSHRSKSLENLLIANNAVFVTPDDGFEDAVDTLWLLSKCQHHVFTNSTFYWWGAFLSSNNFNKDQQHIYAADNFLNQNVYLDNWYKF
jgi:hypothetical protein